MMKLLLRLLYCGVVIILLVGCNEAFVTFKEQGDEEIKEQGDEEMELERSQLKILDIGNSYTDDVTRMLPFLMGSLNIDLKDFVLYKAIRGGASLKSWCDVYNDIDEREYIIDRVVGELPVKVCPGKGIPKSGALFRALLSEEKWDIIIFHQLSDYSSDYLSWNDDKDSGGLEEFLSIIHKNQPNTKLGFYLIHSYSGDYEKNSERSSFERWQLIAGSVKQLCSNYNIDIVIPYGTAIQNLRLSALNDEHDLMRDGTHCGYGLCCYTAACCYYESLFSSRTGVYVLGHDDRFIVPGNQRGEQSSYDVTINNAYIAQLAATLAIKDMYECINPETQLTQ